MQATPAPQEALGEAEVTEVILDVARVQDEGLQTVTGRGVDVAVSGLRGQVHGRAEAAGGGDSANRLPRASEVSARKHYKVHSIFVNR